MATSPAPLVVNSTVFAFHGPLMYEAKVLKVHLAGQKKVLAAEGDELLQDNPKLSNDLMDVDTYLLHYQGWNSKWDEWVTRGRVLECNDENKFKKKELEKLVKLKKRGVKKKAPTILAKATLGPTTKQNTLQNLLGKQSLLSKLALPKQKQTSRKQGLQKPNPSIYFPFNNTLKYLLTDDWEYITKDRKIVDLPSPMPISTILEEYITFREPSLLGEQKDILHEIITGLQLYFDKSLSLVLLYKYENLQYLELLKDHTINSGHQQSKVYGVEHLLRLLISFPALLSQTTMDGVSISVLMNELERLLNFLTENLPRYVNKYNYSSPQYDSLARN